MDTHDTFLGSLYAGYTSYSLDKQIRYLSSSGGFCKSFLHYLLAEDKVDFVIVTRLMEINPLIPETIITNNIEDVLTARTNSIYQPTFPLSIMDQLRPGFRYAFVGLPCHIHAMQKLSKQKELDILLISLLCNHTPKFENLTMEILNSVGIKHDNVQYFEYRGHGWPGSIYIKTFDNRSLAIPSSDFWKWYDKKAMVLSHQCAKCLDFSGVDSDLSVGDAWISEIMEKDNQGTNLLFVRNEWANGLVQNSADLGYIFLESKTIETLIDSQRFLYEVKKKRKENNHD